MHASVGVCLTTIGIDLVGCKPGRSWDFFRKGWNAISIFIRLRSILFLGLHSILLPGCTLSIFPDVMGWVELRSGNSESRNAKKKPFPRLLYSRHGWKQNGGNRASHPPGSGPQASRQFVWRA